MTRREIYAFMNANPTCFLATVEGISVAAKT
jgi:hypothetical protein